ncbi:hypothetical protein HYPSUDRAFT_197200 [Hypholoma sublateritium FD-334 SS-4]|uniref:DUF6534 domain-containing protein n=1 Tax=Hypholoma sublateritium (strain FD-334 SS-4) TaxID=945553 RepID=A0A0D2Q9G0_HYPSF|nr:hypothetical protein HYPSUDRAFT_197200 [Hypholoma sublateritium FD-334 SS-4]
MQVDAGTYGALLLGALFASGLSGVFGVQCLLYFKCYPTDKKALKALVVFAWGLEITHTALVWISVWSYFVQHFGEVDYIDHIPTSIALSVMLTATLTFLAHCLFAHRIYYLSEHNWWLAMPVIVLALGRLAAASVSGAEMIHLRSFARFRKQFLWLFSLGLSLSSAVDILITLSLFLLLRKSRRQSVKLNYLIDALLLYTFEIGSLTSAATVASMLCWSTLDKSLVFLGFHFVIGKLYANSLLATLNSRRKLRKARSTAFNDFVNFNVNQSATVSAIQFQNSENQPGESDTRLADSMSDPEALKNGENDTEE